MNHNSAIILNIENFKGIFLLYNFIENTMAEGSKHRIKKTMAIY